MFERGDPGHIHGARTLHVVKTKAATPLKRCLSHALFLFVFPFLWAWGGCLGPKLVAERPYERKEALLNLTNDSVAAPARQALSDPDWRVAATACTVALKENLRTVAATAAELLKKNKFEDHRLEHFVRLVAHLGRENDRFVLVRFLTHARPAVRFQALRGLDPKALGRPGMELKISVAGRDKDPRIRRMAKNILAKYASSRSRIILAFHAKNWKELGRMHATEHIVRGLRESPADARPFILVSARVAGAPLFLAILRDKTLAALHGQAYAELSLTGSSDPAAKQYEARARKRMAPLIADTLTECSAGSANALDKLAAWARNPQYSFLPELAAAVEKCRVAAGGNPQNNQSLPKK